MKPDCILNQRGNTRDMNIVKPVLKMLRPESTSVYWRNVIPVAAATV